MKLLHATVLGAAFAALVSLAAPAGAAPGLGTGTRALPQLEQRDLQLVHGRRGDRFVRGPHCFRAFAPGSGWHRHARWCNRHGYRDWRYRGWRDGHRRGCRVGPYGLVCRF